MTLHDLIKASVVPTCLFYSSDRDVYKTIPNIKPVKIYSLCLFKDCEILISLLFVAVLSKYDNKFPSPILFFNETIKTLTNNLNKYSSGGFSLYKVSDCLGLMKGFVTITSNVWFQLVIIHCVCVLKDFFCVVKALTQARFYLWLLTKEHW